jgi:hypothetical protein
MIHGMRPREERSFSYSPQGQGDEPMDQDDWRPADSDRQWEVELQTDGNLRDTDWVDGHLEEWWEHLLWSQMVDHENLLSWSLRDGVPVPLVSTHPATRARTIRTQPVYRAWNQKDFALAYPTLAPYAPFPSTEAFGYDPWAAQMYYSVWW